MAKPRLPPRAARAPGAPHVPLDALDLLADVEEHVAVGGAIEEAGAEPEDGRGEDDLGGEFGFGGGGGGERWPGVLVAWRRTHC